MQLSRGIFRPSACGWRCYSLSNRETTHCSTEDVLCIAKLPFPIATAHTRACAPRVERCSCHSLNCIALLFITASVVYGSTEDATQVV